MKIIINIEEMNKRKDLFIKKVFNDAIEVASMGKDGFKTEIKYDELNGIDLEDLKKSIISESEGTLIPDRYTLGSYMDVKIVN